MDRHVGLEGGWVQLLNPRNFFSLLLCYLKGAPRQLNPYIKGLVLIYQVHVLVAKVCI